MIKCGHCGKKVTKDKAMKLYHCSGNCKIASVLFTKEEWEIRYCCCEEPLRLHQGGDNCEICNQLIR